MQVVKVGMNTHTNNHHPAGTLKKSSFITGSEFGKWFLIISYDTFPMH